MHTTGHYRQEFFSRNAFLSSPCQLELAEGFTIRKVAVSEVMQPAAGRLAYQRETPNATAAHTLSLAGEWFGMLQTVAFITPYRDSVTALYARIPLSANCQRQGDLASSRAGLPWACRCTFGRAQVCGKPTAHYIWRKLWLACSLCF